MNMIKCVIAMVCALLIGCSHQTLKGNNQKSYDVNSSFKSVVKIGMDIKIKHKEGTVSGTAWAIDPNHLISAAHVCQAFMDIRKAGVGKDIKITYLDSEFNTQEKIVDVKIVLSDSVNDVCLMEYKRHGLIPLKLAADVKFGEQVYAVGAPLGLIGFVLDGRVVNTGLDISPVMRNKIIVSSAIAGGISGGPVANQNGEVIGIVIAVMTDFNHFTIVTGLVALKPIVALIKILPT
jgi:S1-C subfamily serine protease